MIDAKTKVYAVIGTPIHHSLSPIIHNAAFNYYNLNAVYVAFEVKNLKKAIDGIRELQISGLSVTIPHKQEIIKYLDEIDELSLNIMAVNTVVNENGILKGFNSDGSGAYEAILKSKINIDKSTVIIIGSGGASRAISFTIASKSKVKRLIILGIDEKERKKLVSDINKKKYNIEIISDDTKNIKNYISDCKLMINTSPVGMFPDINNTPVDKKYLNPETAVFDIVYNPYRTKLLADAEEIGCRIIHGTEMFLNQAVIQFELWMQRAAPFDIMKKVLFEKLNINL